MFLAKTKLEKPFMVQFSPDEKCKNRRDFSPFSKFDHKKKMKKFVQYRLTELKDFQNGITQSLKN